MRWARCAAIVTALAVGTGEAGAVTLGPGAVFEPPFEGTGFRLDQSETMQSAAFSRNYVREDGKTVTVLYGGLWSMAVRDASTGRVTVAYQYVMPVGLPPPDSNHIFITMPRTYAAEFDIPGFVGTALDVHVGVDPFGMGSFFPNTVRRSADGDVVTLGSAIPYAGEGMPGFSEQVILESPAVAWDVRMGTVRLVDEEGSLLTFAVPTVVPVAVPEMEWLWAGALLLGVSVVWRRTARA